MGSEGHKVIISSDNISALKVYAAKLQRPLLYGQTTYSNRKSMLDAFEGKKQEEINTILLSKIGDNSIDIPIANVLIQISTQDGSQRQEAQRLGRILRPKQVHPSTSHISRFGHKTSENNAFF